MFIYAFYDHLLACIYQYQKEGTIYVYGDLNSRCGDLDDFIVGVDNVLQRKVVDFTVNHYGDFTVTPVTELLQNIGVFSLTCSPDHSLLSWRINTNIVNLSENFSKDYINSGYDKFDLKNVPNDFMNTHSVSDKINILIDNLEQNVVNKNNIDSVYKQWCDIVKDSMYANISYRTLRNNNSNFRKCRIKKPWWNNHLTELWSKLCIAERNRLSCKVRNNRTLLKAIYVNSRKCFDKEVQKCKRTYWYSLQNDLLQECEVDQNKFWQSIGKIGVSYSGKNKIPEEVLLEDGSTSYCIQDVLDKWRSDFSSLFNYVNITNTDANSVFVTENSNQNCSFNGQISLLEVRNAILQAKNGKASGFDDIPAEVLKNDTAISFLHVFFNLCFNNGIVPSIWGKCIINPIPKFSTLDRKDPLSCRGISFASSVYKVYCRIINMRLNDWVEKNNVLVDEQNSFRKKRSTIDQISALVDIVDTRKKCKLTTFTAFIDFRKAYDCINRNILWSKLISVGLHGKF
jgi:hypothetical protein